MKKIVCFFISLVAAGLSQVATAQEPPGRVGRLAYTQGTVAVYQDPEQGWEKAYVNSPITSQNSVWTDPGARAEVRVAGMALRLDEASQLDIANLDFDDLSAFVARGSVALRVRHFDQNDRIDFNTPHAAFRIQGPGRYRIDVDIERDESVLTVFNGNASMHSAAGDIRVEGGNSVRVGGGPGASFIRERARTVEFDRWTLARDEKWIERRSTQYVSTDMTGYEDLDTYGQWTEEPEYGHVWYPTRVARDWVPYREGRWTWVRPWGWTWVADEPWGYAPYHYGRWVQVRDRWAWYPGRREARPVWAPALVAWVGGSNFNVRFSTGMAPAMGWYPLAPWERYEPWYRTNTTYVNRINVVVRDAPPRQWQGRSAEEWRHWNRDRAATVIRRDQFRDGNRFTAVDAPAARDAIRQAPVAPVVSALPGPQEFRRAPRTASAPPAMPGTAAQQGAASVPIPQQQAIEAPFRRDRNEPAAQPNFSRKPASAPAAAPAQPQTAQPQPPRQEVLKPAQPQGPAASQAPGQPGQPGRGPFGRDDQRTQQQQSQQLQQQQTEQERVAREQQQAQERAARDQQRQSQQLQQQQQAQERAAREQQQRAQALQQQQQQAQERAAREPQRAPALQQQPQQQQQAKPQAPQQAQPPQEPKERAKPLPQAREDKRDKDKDKDDDDKPGKGRGRN